jgi:transposase-like protein
MVKVSKAWIPSAFNGIQYNTCKNPKCEHYGLDPELHPKAYRITYGGKALPLLQCVKCGEVPPIKSNQGIDEEVKRLIAHTMGNKPLSCLNEECLNHGVPVGTKKAYRVFGKTASGTQRYRCNACLKTVSKPKASSGQRDTYHNLDIFKMLVNKVPLSRIVDMLGISWSLLYHRIDYIHAQCMQFAGNRESKLSTMDIERLNIAIDRQDHVINWSERKDKRNVVLSAITSVDNTTHYVFGVHPNFDGNVDRNVIETLAVANGDSTLAAPLRETARYWTQADYTDSVTRSESRAFTTDNLMANVKKKYVALEGREDVENFDDKTEDEQLPSYGLQIHSEYTMIAHFYYLKALMSNVKKWRFFLDQESGIRAACLAVFKDEVKAHKAEAFYVSINKRMTVDEKRNITGASKALLRERKTDFPNKTDNEIKLELLKEAIANISSIGKWQDRWVKHPLPDMSEPEKAMCWITEHEAFDEDHVAWLYNKATLHGVDSFFEKVRRRISLFERTMRSSANDGRTWNGYSAYNPAMVGKLLDIFRVVHNYIDVRKKDGITTTAAMRLGLANAPLSYKDVLYYE